MKYPLDIKKLGITDMGFKECKGHCIDCCGLYTPITEEEYKKLKKLVYKHREKVQEIANFMSVVALNWNCYFADPIKKECIIYDEYIPDICKKFHCNQERIQMIDFTVKRNRFMYEVFGIEKKVADMVRTELKKRNQY